MAAGSGGGVTAALHRWRIRVFEKAQARLKVIDDARIGGGFSSGGGSLTGGGLGGSPGCGGFGGSSMGGGGSFIGDGPLGALSFAMTDKPIGGLYSAAHKVSRIRSWQHIVPFFVRDFQFIDGSSSRETTASIANHQLFCRNAPPNCSAKARVSSKSKKHQR